MKNASHTYPFASTRNILVASIIFCTMLSSCLEGEDIVTRTPTLSTPEQRQAVDYFNVIALGFEGNVSSRLTRKWTEDIVIFVDGEGRSPRLLDELDTVIGELNQLISPSGVELSITTVRSESNLLLFLGARSNFAQLFPQYTDFLAVNNGLFSVDFDADNEIFAARIYVETESIGLGKQRHLIREELTQSLGLGMDSFLFDNSIFQQSSVECTITSYLRIDEVLIQMLYDPRVETGLTENEVTPILEEIVVELL